MHASKNCGFALIACLLAGCQSTGLAFMNALSPEARRTKSIVFAPGERGRMDLYSPKDIETGSGAPLIVFWYGGAWQEGSRTDYRFVGAALAARGAVAVLPDYRLYPEVRFPEFLRDAAAAVARAQQEAPKYGADPRRTVLGGHSAGAYIAAMLALQPQYLREAGVDPASIAGFFGLSGPYALKPNTAVLDDIFISRAAPAAFQPVQQVSERAPPALLAHGASDDVVYPSHTLELAESLRAHGVEVEVYIAPKRRHVDTLIALSRPGAFRIPHLLEVVSAFARKVPVR